jgi:hypothetical protein
MKSLKKEFMCNQKKKKNFFLKEEFFLVKVKLEFFFKKKEFLILKRPNFIFL